MSEQNNKYPERVARMIVDQAIVYGMPVPRVEKMYDYAKAGAAEITSKTGYDDEKRRNSQFFTLLRRFFTAGLKKYSSKMPEYEKMEIRGILTRNRERLIQERTRDETQEPPGK